MLQSASIVRDCQRCDHRARTASAQTKLQTEAAGV